MTRLPIIRTIKPNTFNVGVNLTGIERAKLKALMQSLGNFDWEPPTEEITIESHSEIVKIMQEHPQGKQAIVGKV